MNSENLVASPSTDSVKLTAEESLEVRVDKILNRIDHLERDLSNLKDRYLDATGNHYHDSGDPWGDTFKRSDLRSYLEEYRGFFSESQKLADCSRARYVKKEIAPVVAEARKLNHYMRNSNAANKRWSLFVEAMDKLKSELRQSIAEAEAML